MSQMPHDSSHLHVSGQSEYIDDRSAQQNEVFVEVLYSTKAHAQIVKIDFAPALATKGVVAVFTAKDIIHNAWGSIFQDQPLLADREVQYVGESIALIVAETREIARIARNKIKITYKELPALLSIKAARAKKSFIGNARTIQRGSPEKYLPQCPHYIEGILQIEGADHFYLESQAAMAYPKEDGQLEIHSSTQHPTETQHVVAHALGLENKDVTCIVKRMGGAFGGKESQAAPYAAYVGLVAQKLNRPARIAITKDDDMIATGKRNPFENAYRVGFDHDGSIVALEVDLFSDGGAYADLSTAIMERAMLHIDSAYFIPHLKVTGQVCRTNFHPHTAFRGFGGPKGVATMEKIIEEIAQVLKIDSLEVRKRNCYENRAGRNITHYGQEVRNNCLPELFAKLELDSEYHQRRKKIEEMNKKAIHAGHGKLHGLSLTPVKFGISFTTRFLNQANALVIIHRDGTLQVSTGATEMGQGVNARIAELLSEEIGLDRDFVRVMATSTDKNANTSPTAASSGTDLNGAAALIALRKIKARLSAFAYELLQLPEDRWPSKVAGLGCEKEIKVKEIVIDPENINDEVDWSTGKKSFSEIEFETGFVFSKKNPDQKILFARLVNEAYFSRISLSDYGFYKFPGLSFNKLTGQGEAFLYYTQGVAASEVSIDQSTGETKVQRVDILMDLGRPVNKALDLGQVTGGFVQGMGWVTTEKLFYKDGFLLSHSPSTYKIPSIQDTPRDFIVNLLPNEENKANVRGTKAVGEPPLLLAISVWTAIHNALSYLPQYQKSLPQLSLPAPQEVVLRAIYPDRFSQWERT